MTRHTRFVCVGLTLALIVAGCSDDSHGVLDGSPLDGPASLDQSAGDGVSPPVDGGASDDSRPDSVVADDLQPTGDMSPASDAGADGLPSSDGARDLTPLDSGADTVPPDAGVDTLIADSTADTLAPDSTADTLAPDSTVDTLAPDSTVDTFSGDTTVDSTVDVGPSVDSTVDSTVAPSWLDDTLQDFPNLISDVGIFPDPTNRSAVDARLRYYESRYPLWTDDADKGRWIFLPTSTTIDNTTRAWVFPDGAVLFKHFEYPGQAVETRVMRKRGGSWDFVTYQWNATNDEASLSKGNVTVVINGRPDLNYVIPNDSKCKECHDKNHKLISGNETKVPVIGFDELQLNHTLSGQTTTQVEAFAAQAFFSGALPSTLEAISGTATEVAAKGWIHGNCAHCHNSGFKYDARHPYLEATTINIPQNDSYVVPGDAANSGLFLAAFRWATNGQWPDMAPVGMSITDPQGEAWVEAWINGL